MQLLIIALFNLVMINAQTVRTVPNGSATYINVLPTISCRLCVIEQQRYIRSKGAETTYVAAPFEVDSIARRIKAKLYIQTLKRDFPDVIFTYASEDQNKVCNTVATEESGSGVVEMHSSGVSRFVSYQTIRDGVAK